MERLPMLWIARINIIKMAILSKAIYRLEAIPIKKISLSIFTDIGKSIKFICKHKRPQIDKVILSKKINADGISKLDFKFYYKIIISKITRS
jgi:hypothetical protein